MNQFRKNQGGLRLLAIAFFVLAAILATNLLWSSLKNGPVAGCGRSCDLVLKSSWAYLSPGIPVSAPALFTYLVLLYGLIFKPRSELWQGVFFVGSLMVIGAAIWFVCLQFFVIQSFCKLCCLTHVVGVIASLCTLFGLKSLPREIKPFGVAAAAMALALMVGWQSLLPQKTTATSNLGSAGMTSSGEIVDIGGLSIDIGHFPYRGNPQSSKRMVLLFDYTCTSCRRVHGYLSRAEERFGKDNYLVVMLPVPLNPDCNRHIKEPMPDHRDACLFAQIGLAMWGIDQEKFHEYDHWMIESGSARFPPTADAARAKAEELVGKEILDEALAQKSVGTKLEHATKIWNFLKEKTGRMAMPKMVWSNGNLTDGGASSEFELFNTMEKQLGLKRQN
ncbi:MAG: putative membrane protein [Verrucomicrobiales bacterium]|jgi:uncharacterized membrane protein